MSKIDKMDEENKRPLPDPVPSLMQSENVAVYCEEGEREGVLQVQEEERHIYIRREEQRGGEEIQGPEGNSDQNGKSKRNVKENIFNRAE